MRTAHRFLIRGRVQGVGYRDFAQRAAREIGVLGYARNLDDGRVEVYAIGTLAQLDELAGRLEAGPRMSDVRGVERIEAEMLHYESFSIKH